MSNKLTQAHANSAYTMINLSTEQLPNIPMTLKDANRNHQAYFINKFGTLPT